MPQICRTQPHAAFMVDDLDAALEGQDVVVEPFDATETLRVAFIKDGDALIELMQEDPAAARHERTAMAMKKFINDPDDLVDELLEGFALANARQGRADRRTTWSSAPTPKAEDKVALVTLGGSGHEPALSGFVGEGMLDISVPGEIFAAPGPPRVLEALRLANRDAGVLFVVLNHEGDVMSANMAMEMAEKEGLNVKHDPDPRGHLAPARARTRRTAAGWSAACRSIKVAGAAAEQGSRWTSASPSPSAWSTTWRPWPWPSPPRPTPATGEPISEVPRRRDGRRHGPARRGRRRDAEDDDRRRDRRDHGPARCSRT